MSPLVPLCAAWLLGLACAGLTPPVAATRGWLALTATGLAALLLSRARVPGAAPAAQRLQTVVLLGAALTAGYAAGPAGHDALAPPAGLARLVVDVGAVRRGDGWASSAVTVVRGKRSEDGAVVAPGTRLRITPHPLPLGARVRVLARLHPVTPFRNPSPHPRWPRPDDVDGRGVMPGPGGVAIVAQPAHWALLEGLRGQLRAALEGSLPPRHAGAARALLLGEGAAMRQADRARVRAAGLSHVFAVSGLHIAILAGMLVWGLRAGLLCVPPLGRRFEARRLACAVGVPLSVAMAVFAGGAPSALRAGAATALTWLLVAAGRKPRPGAVMSAVVMLLTAADPALAMRPGMLLSVAATTAILTLPGELRQRPLRALCALSLRTMLATGPLVLWCFGAVPLVGLLANVLLLPIGSALLLPLAALHGASASLLPAGAELTGPALSLALDAFMAACDLLGGLEPLGAWPPPTPGQGAVVGAWALCMLALRGARQRLLATALALACLAGLEARLRAREKPTGVLRATFLDVGQGDGALVDLPDGRLMLIDAGGATGGGPDPGERVILPLLRARRRARVDIVVLSHPHPDHYGGLSAVLSALPVTQLWDSGQAAAERDMSPTSAATVALLQRARHAGTRIVGPEQLCRRPLHAGGAHLRVLWPCPGYDSGLDPNDNSLVVRIDFGRRSLLFTGDVERLAEARLTASALPLRADVLKVPHHGSRTSSSAALLARIRPGMAIVSAGAHNRYGHPHAEVRERLHAQVPHVISLAAHGGTVVTTDGEALWARAWDGTQVTLEDEASLPSRNGRPGADGGTPR